MKCPHCRHAKAKVTETRKTEYEVWRRKRCDGCGESFVSYERTDKELRMPSEIWADRQRRLQGSTGADLQGIWQ